MLRLQNTFLAITEQLRELSGLILNGYEVAASVDEQEGLIFRLADSYLEREELLAWL